MPTLIDHARALRKNHTEAESHLWYLIRNRGLLKLKFKRQVPIGPYIVDFLCPAKKMIIELDGGQHIEQAIYDTRRTAFLESKGYKVIRFWNHEILCDTDAVLDVIFRKAFGETLPSPQPFDEVSPAATHWANQFSLR